MVDKQVKAGDFLPDPRFNPSIVLFLGASSIDRPTGKVTSIIVLCDLCHLAVKADNC